MEQNDALKNKVVIWTRARKFSAALVLWGVGCFLGLAVFSLGLWTPRRLQLPMSDLKQLAIDKDGNIYCASLAYSRIQVYTSEGNFIRGWFSGVRGGKFHMRLNDKGNLEVVPWRGHSRFIYNADGDVIWRDKGEESLDDESKRLPSFDPKPQYKDQSGSVYLIVSPIINPSVVKLDPSGRESTIISTPFYLWLVMGPLPALLIAFIGGMIGKFADARLRKLNDSDAPQAGSLDS